MSKFPTILAALGALSLAGSPALAHGNKAEEAKEKSVAMAQVPKPAVDAAKKALGADPTDAKVMTEKGQKVYELSAKDASGAEKAVHVSASGKVMKTETEAAQK
jgi:uncharacterized membrane protein YkoI